MTTIQDQEEEYRLLFAVPKKGRLYEKVMKLLAGAGLEYTRAPRLDLAQVKGHNVSLVFLPAHDIAEYVAEGDCDLGITGQDIIAEADLEVKTVLEFGFGNCDLCLQGPKGKFKSAQELSGKRVVTSFPAISKKYFEGIDAPGKPTQIKYVTGSVEVACALGIADGIVDLVETGTTMKAAGLEIVETIMASQTVLITKKEIPDKAKELVKMIRNRFQGFLTSTKMCLISYNISSSLVQEACKVTPGMDGPTISELASANMKAVSALIKKKEQADIMDRLAALGARSILVMGLDNCRFPGVEGQDTDSL